MPIKSYSPELMVEGVYSASEFDKLVKNMNNEDGEGDGDGNLNVDTDTDTNTNTNAIINEKVNEMVQKVVQNFVGNRIHSIIIGPGLGRCPLVLDATAKIIQNAMEVNLNIVLDADGLYLLSLRKNWDLFLNGLYEYSNGSDASNDNGLKSKSKVVLTPNVVEYKRLVDTMGEGSEDILRSRLAGVTIVKKGYEDVIEYIPKVIMSSGQRDLEEQGLGQGRDNSSGHDNDNDNGDGDHLNVQPGMVCTEQGGLKRSGGLGKTKEPHLHFHFHYYFYFKEVERKNAAQKLVYFYVVTVSIENTIIMSFLSLLL